MPVGGGEEAGTDRPRGDGAASIAALRKIARRREEAQERCEFCSVALPDDHEHLYDVPQRQLACSLRGPAR